jgi:soluble lytic murein transglycosylase
MRVTESMRIYDALLTGRLPDQTLTALLQQR